MVFEKYDRVHTGNPHDVQGFGLGLSWVKLLVAAHGGRITLERELHSGTMIRVFLSCLPAVAGRARPTGGESLERSRSREAGTSHGTKKILLLEDDPHLGFLLQENLELLGFQVRRCANGQEGAAACRETAFDLCLVDVMMPRQDGFTFAAELRQGGQRAPLIFLTAKSLKEDTVTAFKLGCDDHITEPFSLEELMLRIQAVLKRAAPGRTAERSLHPRPFQF